MKRALLLPLLAAAVPAAFAASNYAPENTAVFTDLSQNSTVTINDTTVDYTASTGTFISTDEGGNLSYGSNQQACSFTFRVDIKGLESTWMNANDTSTRTLVAFYFLGAANTTNGVTTYPNEGKNGVGIRFDASTNNVYLSHTSNAGSSWTNWATLSGSQLTSVMVAQTGTSGGAAYMYLYDNSGSGISTTKGLGSKSNGAVTSIVVDTEFVTAASVATTVSLNTDGMKEAAKAIPEPASATLSLLALACLTARRRRR